MEVNVSLQDYLDSVKEQFSLDSRMPYNKVLTILRNEISFRESLIKTIVVKVKSIQELIGVVTYDDYLENLRISGLENFKLDFEIGQETDYFFIKNLVDLKLDYIFNVSFYTSFGKIIMRVTLNGSKLEKIKRYI